MSDVKRLTGLSRVLWQRSRANVPDRPRDNGSAGRAWSIDVFPDGKGLPPGKGSVPEGKAVYDARCAACHGATGEGGLADRLVGGINTLKSGKPVKTLGSYWPYASTAYDYIYRAMPYDRPKSLTLNEVYAVIAYLLHLNNIVDASTTIDAATLPEVRMPNSGGITADPRSDVANVPAWQTVGS